MTTARSLRVGEALLGCGVLGLGLLIGVETALIEVAPSHATVGPRLFPLLVAGALLIVGALVLREALTGKVAHADGGVQLDLGAAALVAAGLLAQLLLLEQIGWIPAGALLFMVTARAFGSRRLLVDLLIGLAVAGAAFAVFDYGLGLGLPTGTLIEPLLSGADGDAG